MARTHASHAWNTGSIPVGATSKTEVEMLRFFYCCLLGLLFSKGLATPLTGALGMDDGCIIAKIKKEA